MMAPWVPTSKAYDKSQLYKPGNKSQVSLMEQLQTRYKVMILQGQLLQMALICLFQSLICSCLRVIEWDSDDKEHIYPYLCPA